MAAPYQLWTHSERIARVPWSFLGLVFCGMSLKILDVCVSFVSWCMLGILAVGHTEETMSAFAQDIGVSLPEYLEGVETWYFWRGFTEGLAFPVGAMYPGNRGTIFAVSTAASTILFNHNEAQKKHSKTSSRHTPRRVRHYYVLKPKRPR